MPELKNVRWFEGQYNFHYCFIEAPNKRFRIGMVSYYGHEPGRRYKAFVSLFDQVWEGFFDSIEEAKEAVPAMVEHFIEQMTSCE